MLDKYAIYQRFVEYYPTKTPYELAMGFASIILWPLPVARRKMPCVPWRMLKTLVDEEGVCWDWLLEGKEPKHSPHGERNQHDPLYRHVINTRFLSLFPGLSQGKLAKELGVKQMSVHRWYHDISQVPWERLKYAVDFKGVTWE